MGLRNNTQPPGWKIPYTVYRIKIIVINHEMMLYDKLGFRFESDISIYLLGLSLHKIWVFSICIFKLKFGTESGTQKTLNESETESRTQKDP